VCLCQSSKHHLVELQRLLIYCYHHNYNPRIIKACVAVVDLLLHPTQQHACMLCMVPAHGQDPVLAQLASYRPITVWNMTKRCCLGDQVAATWHGRRTSSWNVNLPSAATNALSTKTQLTLRHHQGPCPGTAKSLVRSLVMAQTSKNASAGCFDRLRQHHVPLGA
jgi:hypothetical protein